MSAWGIVLAPVIAAANTAGDGSGPYQETIELPADSPIVDVFGELAPMDSTAMSEASGGSETAIDIGDVGVNESKTQGLVKEVENNNTTNGEIAGNSIASNSGITTIFNNTGNGVVMQSTVNVNVFLD